MPSDESKGSQLDAIGSLAQRQLDNTVSGLPGPCLHDLVVCSRSALGTAANTDTKLLIYGLFQKGRVLAQDGVRSIRAFPSEWYHSLS